MEKQKKEIKKESRIYKWSRRLLLWAIILNSIALVLNLYIVRLEDSFTDRHEKEWYFVTNQQAISSEIAKRTLLHTSLNQLKMLRRISKDRLSPSEYKCLLHDEDGFQRQIDSSLIKIAGASYLQGNDPPPGFSPDRYFAGMSQDDLAKKLPENEDKALAYAKGLKKDMVSLTDQISFWKTIYASSIIVSTILLLMANYIYFRLGKLNGDIN